MGQEFQPTHRLCNGSGEVIEVCLVDGQAFQRWEWDAGRDEAEYERHGEGRWLFRGKPFQGSVVSVKKAEA